MSGYAGTLTANIEATMQELKQRLFDYITKSSSVSFVELSRIEGFKGDFEMKGPEGYNVLLWTDMSEQACYAMLELLKEKKIEMLPTSFFVYLCDGCTLDIPLFKGRKTKALRWQPVVFNVVKKRA